MSRTLASAPRPYRFALLVGAALWALPASRASAHAGAPLGVAAEAYRQASEVTPETTLFTLGAVVCGASSVATPDQRAVLHQVLLDCPEDRRIDNVFPVRGAITGHVQNWSLASRRQALKFLLDHAMAITNFNALVLQLVGPPPSFAVIPGGAVAGLSDNWTAADRRTLSAMLQNAWSEGNLMPLWRTMSPSWHNAQISPARVRQVAQQLDRYVHLPRDTSLTLAYVTVDPMMPAGSGVTSIFADNHYAIILGPSVSSAEAHTLLAHELAHPIVNAFFHGNLRAQRALHNANCVYDAVLQDPEGRTGIGGVYTSWDVYFAETLVRSLSHHIMETTEAADGFILQPTVAWELARYDTSHYSFEELMVRSLSRLQTTFCSQPKTIALQQRFQALKARQSAGVRHRA